MAGSGVQLQLGDIVRVVAPDHDVITDDPLFVKEFGDTWIRMIGRNNTVVDLPLGDDGTIKDERITAIELLSRAPPDQDGYARQNGLVPGQWIDLHFGGDRPMIVTGQVVDLDEDQIEVKVVDGGKPLFIDFAYRGIPEDIPLKHIDLRDAPASEQEDEPVTGEGDERKGSPARAESDAGGDVAVDEGDEPDLEFDIGSDPSGALPMDLRAQILAPDEIAIGGDLESVTQIVDVPDAERRFGIAQQTTDLLDDMLASLPTNERTPAAVNAVHKLIERFRELREEYSVFETGGHVAHALARGSEHKPVLNELIDLKTQVHWAIPITKNRKKIYDLDAEEAGEYEDVVPLTQADTRTEESRIIESYREDTIQTGVNRYDTMLRDLAPFLCPWSMPAPGGASVVFSSHVDAHITAVVDNFGDMRSSVVKDERLSQKKFFIQPHARGLDVLGIVRHAGGEITYNQRQVVPGDPISVTGLMTLPSQAIQASRAVLPSTDVASRVDLAPQLAAVYGMLGPSTDIQTSTGPGTGFKTLLSTPIEHIHSGDTGGSWEDLLKRAIPTTAALAKSWLSLRPHPPLSVHAAIRWLEPFRVYSWNLHEEGYNTILGHVSKSQKEQAARSSAAYKTLSREIGIRRSSKARPPPLLAALAAYPIESAEVEAGYGLGVSSEEVMMRTRKIDGGRLIMSALAKLSVDLMQGNAEVEAEKIAVAAKRKAEAATSSAAGRKCATPGLVLAKRYLAFDELEEDNNKPTTFDRHLDPTFYDVLEEYNEVLEGAAGSADRQARLEAALKEKTGMRGTAARREALAMLSGERAVEDGDYAVVEPDGDGGAQAYYARKNNAWVSMPELSAMDFDGPTKVRCDLRPDCVAMGDDCLSADAAKAALVQQDWSEMEAEFDRAVDLNIQARRKMVADAFKRAARRAPLLRKLQIAENLKVQRQRYALGRLGSEELARRSPHAPLRDLILGQADLAKRQANVARFVDRFTRPAQDGSDEDTWWLYCVDTGIKLLPAFLATLARAFLDGTGYLDAVRRVCTQQGTISDDGEAWVDKYSGYAIVPIDYDDDEGYTEAGFKVQSRAILAQELDVNVVPTGAARFEDPKSKAVAQIAVGLAGFMGAGVEDSLDFIVRMVTDILLTFLPPRAAYEAAVEKKKKRGSKGVDSYSDLTKKTTLLVTSSVTLLAIQTQVPPIVPTRRFPGCVATLTGYPMGAVGELGAVKYISCIIRRISRTSVPPWNGLKGIDTKSIKQKLETILARQVLPLQAAKRRIQARRQYNRLNPESQKVMDPALQAWVNFLPPLSPVKVTAAAGVTDKVRRVIEKMLRGGDRVQDEKIRELQGRAIMLSLKVIELVEATVKDKSLSLASGAGDLYLENSCCDEAPRNPLAYFEKAQHPIVEKNLDAGKVRDFLDDLGLMARAPMLFDAEDTRRVFPPVDTEFSEDTIYRAFIVFCKYDSPDLAVNPRLRDICASKPESYDLKASIEDKIQTLKTFGLEHNQRSLQQLMQIVDEDNLVKLDLGMIALSNGQNLLATFEDPDLVLPSDLGEKLQGALEARIGADGSPPEKVREFRNFLATETQDSVARVSEFLGQASSLSTRAGRRGVESAVACIRGLASEIEASSNGSQSLPYMKDYMHLLVRVFPSIVTHGVSYADIAVPAHWKLSHSHDNQIKAFVERYYAPLVPFYGDAGLRPLLMRYSHQCMGLYTLLGRLYPDTGTSPLDDRTTGMMASYLLCRALAEYTWLATRDPTIARAAAAAELAAGVGGGEGGDEELDFGEDDGSWGEGSMVLAGHAADLMVGMLDVVCNQRRLTELSYTELMRLVHRSKEHEKDLHVAALGALTDEERDVEMQLRRVDLKSRGTGGGAYQASTYDQEISQMEAQAMAEIRAGEQHMVTAMNRDIYAMDAIAEQAEADRIEAEEASLAHLGDDDDFGDQDGDEGY